ncbi:hypothetical protein U1Q18_005001, partial [Sarracenia purpurea var. burkii]
PDHRSGDWDRHGFASSCPHITVAGVVVFTSGTSDFSALVRGHFWFEVRYCPRRGDREVFGRGDLTRNLVAIKLRRRESRHLTEFDRDGPGDSVRSTHYCELSDINRDLAGDSAVAEVEMHEALEINDRNRNGTGNEVVCNILDGESAPLTNVRQKFTGDLISDQAEDLEVPEGADARRYLVGDAFLVGDYAGANTVGRSGSSSFLPCSQPFGLLSVRGWVREDGVDRVRSGLLCAVSNFSSHHRVLRGLPPFPPIRFLSHTLITGWTAPLSCESGLARSIHWTDCRSVLDPWKGFDFDGRVVRISWPVNVGVSPLRLLLARLLPGGRDLSPERRRSARLCRHPIAESDSTGRKVRLD